VTAVPGVAALGIDLIEIDRVERALERRPRLAERLFRPGELAACADRARPGRHLAARFAAKEAAIKALGGGCGPRDVEVVPLVGGLKSTESLVASQELVRELAGRLGATYRYLHAPALLRSKAARDALLVEPSIADALARARGADIALVGIGTVGTGSSKEVVDELGLSAAERAAFLAADPVGDACCRFFDVDGRPIGGAVHDRVVAVELEHLAVIPVVVGVATGTEKASGVLGALRGGVLDGLITDAALALALLDRVS